ncbi:MAG: hypothetical protein ACLPTF_11375 [Steroidobacteraceae bacterium]
MANNPTGPLVISGDIARGDYERLLSKIADDENRFLSQNKIIVASTAGDVSEALKIAKLIKALHSEVSVGPLTGKCVGACFLIYAAADQRATDGEQIIGISGLDHADPTGGTPLLASAVRKFLRENEVPDYLAEALFQHAPGNVYWLSDQDEANLKFRAPSFSRYLAANCAWDDELERAAALGKRSFADLQPMWACRTRITQADARKALAAAR